MLYTLLKSKSSDFRAFKAIESITEGAFYYMSFRTEAQNPEQPGAPDGEVDFNAGFTNKETPGGVPGPMPGGPEFGGPSSMGQELMHGGPEGGLSMPSFGGPGQGTPLSRGVDYKLFRFVDFTVQPGKRYKYRVKLVLQDPNFNVDKSFLSPEVLDRNPKVSRVVEAWSEPSPTVGIPLAGGVRLG